MSDVLAVVRVEHPDLGLTETVAHDETATVRPIREAGTDPTTGRYLFAVESEDFDVLEAGLRADHTVDAFERVADAGTEAIYRLEYADEAKLFSPEITSVGGVAINWENEGTTWDVKVWMPDREALRNLWDYADANDIDIELVRVNEYSGIVDDDLGLTDPQREALLTALEMGYFEEPREADLQSVAEELSISQPAAGGRLRRAMKRLVVSTVAERE